MASNVVENIKRTTQATLDGLNAWDHDALVAVRSDDFVFQGLPLSLHLPSMNNEEYREMWFNMMTPAFQNFKVISPSHNLYYIISCGTDRGAYNYVRRRSQEKYRPWLRERADGDWA